MPKVIFVIGATMENAEKFGYNVGRDVIKEYDLIDVFTRYFSEG